MNLYIHIYTYLYIYIDDAEMFTSEIHDPALEQPCLKIRKYKETPSRVGPVWIRPNTLRRLSQKTFVATLEC